MSIKVFLSTNNEGAVSKPIINDSQVYKLMELVEQQEIEKIAEKMTDMLFDGAKINSFGLICVGTAEGPHSIHGERNISSAYSTPRDAFKTRVQFKIEDEIKNCFSYGKLSPIAMGTLSYSLEGLLQSVGDEILCNAIGEVPKGFTIELGLEEQPIDGDGRLCFVLTKKIDGIETKKTSLSLTASEIQDDRKIN